MIVPRKVSYQDVKTVVLNRIRDSTWAPGSIMPGEIDLAKEFGCARATVNRAMRELAEEGFIDRKRKAGTRIKLSPTRQAKFVIPLIRDEIEGSGAPYRYALINRDVNDAPDWLRARMGLTQNTRALHLSCMHYAGRKSFQYEDRWINLGAVPKAADQDFKTIGPNEWLIKEVPFSDAEITFSTITADPITSELLRVSIGTALFTLERITWLESAPITYTKLYFHSGYEMTSRL
jgi:GntR family histidine utilization transcriptional repressor